MRSPNDERRMSERMKLSVLRTVQMRRSSQDKWRETITFDWSPRLQKMGEGGR